MVNIALPSLSVTLDAGHAEVLEKVVSPIVSDAVITIENTPTDPTHSNTLLSLLQSIEFRNLNSLSSEFDDIRFRMSETNYGRLAQYMTDMFTPEWVNTDVADGDHTNDAMIRAKLDNAGATITNTMTLTVEEGSVPAPGNFNDSEHGCFPDLHIGYVAAALTNAHEGRAVILNEESIFASMHNNSGMHNNFGTQFTSQLWNSANADSGGSGYRQLDLEGGSAGPLKELLSALYHEAPDRFQESTLNETEEFQTLPIESGDTMSIKVTVTGSLKMSTLSLTTPTSDGANILPLIIPTASKANPSTYSTPFNVDESVASNVASDTAVATQTQELNYEAGVLHNGVDAVSVHIRPQKYEVKVVLGAVPCDSFGGTFFRVDGANFHLRTNGESGRTNGALYLDIVINNTGNAIQDIFGDVPLAPGAANTGTPVPKAALVVYAPSSAYDSSTNPRYDPLYALNNISLERYLDYGNNVIQIQERRDIDTGNGPIVNLATNSTSTELNLMSTIPGFDDDDLSSNILFRFIKLDAGYDPQNNQHQLASVIVTSGTNAGVDSTYDAPQTITNLVGNGKIAPGVDIC